MCKTFSGLLLTSFVLAGALAPAPAQDAAGLEFFEKKIRPVLVEHCYQCHTSDLKTQKGGLALDSRQGVLKGGESGAVVVPGKPGESRLIQAVRYSPDLRMPPKGKLPAEVIADLEKWVALGAPDPRSAAATHATYKGPSLDEGRRFWAFQPPRRPPPPALHDAHWPRGDLDRFILAKLEAKRLRPAGDANRSTLIRRAYFALIGLPPTPAQIDAFVQDRSPDAFAKVVDQLLASPSFGERWGRHWLDVARFAQSTGGGRSMLLKDAWRYRDYVIQSFNQDKPFDRFILEQIAGDLLPASTPEERAWNIIALAFLMLGPTNYERQDKPILEMDVIDEQLDTMGRAFLGMTIGCARCHDHKFDPIPTADYYALAGILKSTKSLVHDNVSKWVERSLPMSPQMEQLVKAHDAQVAALKERIKLAQEAEKKAGLATADGPSVKGALAARDLPGIVVDDAHAKKVGSWKASKFTGNYIGDGYLYDDRGMKGEKTLTFVPEFTNAGMYDVRLAYVPHTNRADKVPVRVFHADGENTVHVNQKTPPPIDGSFVSLGHYRFEPGSQWFVMLSTAGTNGHVVADAVQFLPEEKAEENLRPSENPRTAVRGLGPVRGLAEDSKKLEAQLKALLAAGPERPTAMCVAEGDNIADMHVCVRGNVHNKGPTVPRGFLQVATVGPAPVIPPKESGRRQLAQWLASPANPLTARVTVNRVWHHLFGAGLVRTVDNFGATGETPSHPELLDHLAVEFMENGWSIKKLIRRIMLSRTWQMASEVDARSKEGLAADPENRLLWRMNRRRLEAECLRDAMLHVAGKLDGTGGGPNIKKGTTIERDYQFDNLRRSVYTPVFRNRLPELFEVFDFADPNLAVGKRNVSTVPTQALYMMNSPFVMEQARQAAKSALAASVATDEARVDHAYRVAIGRLPTERERRLALDFLARTGEGNEQRLAAWERLYQSLFACIDFRYVN